MIPNHVDREAAARKKRWKSILFNLCCFLTLVLCIFSTYSGCVWAALVGFLFGLFDLYYYYKNYYKKD